MKEFRVGVFEHPRKLGVRMDAYTVWFNPEWKGCCVHVVQAENGTRVKVLAKQEHREQHMGRPSQTGTQASDQ